MEHENNRLGDVVQTTTTTFVTQCYEIYDAPSLGEMVKTNGEYPTYGVVHEVSTQGIDPSRKPIARGQREIREEDVYTNNPQLRYLLRTDFHTTIMGYKNGSEIMYHLPPLPPPIYSFVYRCSDEDVRILTSNPSMLRTLTNSNIVAIEEVIAALLRSVCKLHSNPDDFLTEMGLHLASSLPGDFKKVESILKRVQNA